MFLSTFDGYLLASPSAIDSATEIFQRLDFLTVYLEDAVAYFQPGFSCRCRRNNQSYNEARPIRVVIAANPHLPGRSSIVQMLQFEAKSVFFGCNSSVTIYIVVSKAIFIYRLVASCRVRAPSRLRSAIRKSDSANSGTEYGRPL